MAVSYTHLDVYKRQQKTRTENGNYRELQDSLDRMLDAQEKELRQERQSGRRLLGENYLVGLLRKEEKWDPQFLSLIHISII